MRYVDRSTVEEPPSLKAPSPGVLAEIKAAELFYKTYDPLAPKAKGYQFKEYKGYDVTQALRTLFHDKCAYCESEVGDNLDVEPFRPKGGVAGDKNHKGYWWLAHRWVNLLPSCTPCNQKRVQHLVTEQMTVEELAALMAKKPRKSHGKANQFPISGARAYLKGDDLIAEQPLLIDPTAEDPSPYFRWALAGHFSVLLPAANNPAGQPRALNTISVFALNRSRLVESRTKLLTILRFHAQEIRDELKADSDEGGISPGHVNKALERVERMRLMHAPDQRYSAMIKAFFDDFAKELVSKLPTP